MSTNLKIDVERFQIISNFHATVETLIDKGAKGDSKALDEARKHIRWMEGSYHSTPAQLRLKVPRVPVGNVPKSSEEWLALLQPPTDSRRHKDWIIPTLTGIVVGVVTFLITRFVFGG